jgi:ribonuclease HI
MTDRTEIFTDGSYNDQTDTGGWAAVVFRKTSGQQTGTTNQEMELRAIVEAVKMAEGPTTIVSDHEGIVGLAQAGRTPRWSTDVWNELYAAAAGKYVTYEWRRRDQSFGQRLAHQLARDAVKGRGA